MTRSQIQARIWSIASELELPDKDRAQFIKDAGAHKYGRTLEELETWAAEVISWKTLTAQRKTRWHNGKLN